MQIKRDWDGEIFASHGTNLSRGVTVLITSRLDYNVRQIRSDSDGRVVNILLDVEDETINLVNVNAPSSDFQRQIFFLFDIYPNIIGGGGGEIQLYSGSTLGQAGWESKR